MGRKFRYGKRFEALLALGRRSPAAAFALAGAYGRLGARFGKEPFSAALVREALGLPKDAPVGSLLSRMRSAHNRDRVLVELVHREGYRPLASLIRWEDKGIIESQHRQKRGAILACIHVGVAHGILVALRTLGIGGCVLAGRPEMCRSDLLRRDDWIVAATDSSENRPLAARAALERLRNGGLVMIAPDSSRSDTVIPVSFLGRRMGVSRGVAALARLSGASIIPVITSWSPWRSTIRVRAFEPLQSPTAPAGDPAAYEREIMRTLFAFFERQLRASPEILRLNRLKVWHPLPKWDGDGEGNTPGSPNASREG